MRWTLDNRPATILGMASVKASDQPSPERHDVEHEAFMAAVEDGLADLKAGRFYSHEEVQAEMLRRFPPPAK